MLGLLLCNLHDMTGFDLFEPFSMSRGVWAVDGGELGGPCDQMRLSNPKFRDASIHVDDARLVNARAFPLLTLANLTG